MQLARYVKFRAEQFGGVLFETQTEKVYTLNAPAAAVIREILAGAKEEQIPARLKAQFQGPEEQIEREVRALIDDLRQKGLVGDGPG